MISFWESREEAIDEGVLLVVLDCAETVLSQFASCPENANAIINFELNHDGQ